MSNITYPKYKLPDNLVVSSATASVGFSGSFIGDGSRLENLPLGDYVTKVEASGTFISSSQLDQVLLDYPTLDAVSGTFISQSQIDNFVTGVISEGNLTGSGILGDPVILKDEINVYAITSSYLLNGLNVEAIGNYSHAEGRGTSAEGDYSHVEGHNATALGDYSHAEGDDASSIGPFSHAEGYSTQAVGEGSHAEGETSEAIGDYSHAEGDGTEASGYNSHSEGRSTKAIGNYSHVEGWSTQAYGHYSHAEGYNTIASASHQHVQGQWNQTSSTALHLIGNGTDEENRSNIFEVYIDKVIISGSQEISGNLSASYFYGDGSNITNLVLSSIPSLSASYVLYVSVDAEESVADGSFNRPFKTLQTAVDYASSSYNDFSVGVEIRVGPGTYSGINVTRRNTYFVSQYDNHRQRAVKISGPTRIQVSGTQKYNEVCGFDGFLFDTGSGTESLVHVQGTGSTGLYIQNCQFYSNTTDSNCNLLRIDGTYNEEKVVLKDCAFSAGQTGADLVKITGGDIEFDSCRFIVSGSGASSAISASGDVGIIADRALIENISSTPAISFTSARTFVLSNASVTKGGTGRAIQSVAPTFLLNSYFAPTGSNPALYSNNLNISGSGIYYSHLTSLFPQLKVSVTTGTPLEELHGNIYATNISASSITGAISIPNVAYVNTQNVFTTNQIITGSLYLTNNVSASNLTSSGLYTNYIDFNTTIYPAPPPPTAQLGRIFYNGASGDLSTYLDTGGLYLNNGQQLIQKCMNKSGDNLLKGTVVHISGSENNTDTPHINVADWSNDDLSANTLGVVMQDIVINQTGYILTQGVMSGLTLGDLTGLTNGQVLYLSSSGQITNVKPSSPKHTVTLGQLIAKASNPANKTIYVSIQNGYELSELHDVSASNGKSNGDLLAWDSSVPAWKNTKELSGSYNISGSLTLGDIFKAPQKTKLNIDPGELGQICWNDSNIFVYTSTGWKSSSLN